MTIQSVPRIEKPSSLTDLAYDAIKDIVLNRSRSGDALVVENLASRLGISRTPIREALLRLQVEGLVETIQYRGTFITWLSKEEIRQIHEVRGVLEALAIRLATPRIPDEILSHIREMFQSAGRMIEQGKLEGYFLSDTEFHSLIVQYAGNEVLRELLGNLSDRVYRIRVYSKNRPGRHLEESFNSSLDK